MAVRRTDEPYFPRLADKIVREGMDIYSAAEDLELGLKKDEIDKLQRNPVFKTHLGLSQIRWYREIGTDPKRDKEYLEGFMLDMAEKLAAGNSYKEASEAALKYAKLKGYVGDDTTTNAFANLSPSEKLQVLEALKKEKKQAAESVN